MYYICHCLDTGSKVLGYLLYRRCVLYLLDFIYLLYYTGIYRQFNLRVSVQSVTRILFTKEQKVRSGADPGILEGGRGVQEFLN